MSPAGGAAPVWPTPPPAAPPTPPAPPLRPWPDPPNGPLPPGPGRGRRRVIVGIVIAVLVCLLVLGGCLVYIGSAVDQGVHSVRHTLSKGLPGTGHGLAEGLADTTFGATRDRATGQIVVWLPVCQGTGVPTVTTFIVGTPGTPPADPPLDVSNFTPGPARYRAVPLAGPNADARHGVLDVDVEGVAYDIHLWFQTSAITSGTVLEATTPGNPSATGTPTYVDGPTFVRNGQGSPGDASPSVATGLLCHGR